MNGLHVAFLTDSGPAVGLGHLSRCLALAGAVATAGARTSLLVRGAPPVRLLEPGAAASIDRFDWILDPPETLRRLRALHPDVIVVDSYAASPTLLAALRELGPVVAVDDLADRPLPVDVVVNGSVGAETRRYDRGSGALFLLGPRYALLDPAYARAPLRPAGRRVERLLVCLGGSRQPAALAAALAAADRVLEGAVLDVATGGLEGDATMAAPGGAPRNRAIFHRARFGLRELMEEADVAISGAGVTLHELAATATPAVAILVAPNQRPNLDAFVRAGAALEAGAVTDPGLAGAIESALRRLVGDPALRADLGARGRALVDGGGAARVALALGCAAVSRR
jgi:UDP-2,4-diacetamido-2,4,6-trideoxy-beta-L-altropyranose hydrolase